MSQRILILLAAFAAAGCLTVENEPQAQDICQSVNDTRTAAAARCPGYTYNPVDCSGMIEIRSDTTNYFSECVPFWEAATCAQLATTDDMPAACKVTIRHYKQIL